MAGPVLHVLADDLTGACDMAAALLPWDGDVTVEATPAEARAKPEGLRVINTQSRLLTPAEARAAVVRAVAPARGDARAIVLKKIDTALRGQLGVEIDAAMDAAGAAEAFVLAAIPEVGRTTVDGVQRHHGVPVDQTAFARDPLHPVDDARIGVHVERGSAQRAAVVSLADVRAAGGMERAVAAGRQAGATVFVCDAETDGDLERALDALLSRPRPLVLVGSLGLGRALRRRVAPTGVVPARPITRRRGTGTLVIVGSLHPNARAQSDAVARGGVMVEGGAAGVTEGHVRDAVMALTRGEVVVLRSSAETVPEAAAAVLTAIGRAARACVDGCVPGALVLVGGETAYAVLAALGQPCIRIVREVESLVVGGALVGGALAGTPIVTKGGSAGDATVLVRAVRWLAEGSR